MLDQKTKTIKFLILVCLAFLINWKVSPFKSSLHTKSLLKKLNKNYHQLYMGFDTIVEVGSNFEAKCSLNADKDIGLTNYMQLPVEQYVCIKMPLDATLQRIDTNRFNLTVPPVRFFNLDVSPTLLCTVTQGTDAVVIESNECILRGSPYVESLNGCFRMKIKTSFKWIDSSHRKSILSNSNIYVEVDPPAPFKFFGKNILEKTGSLAMSIALRQIENAFVSSLSKDYERWAVDMQYRMQRAGRFPQNNEVKIEAKLVEEPIAEEPTVEEPVVDVDSQPEPPKPILVGDSSQRVTSIRRKPLDSDMLTDDICLLPGEPVIRIEQAPSNSRRIYSGIDISASVEDVWETLTDYENLQNVVPSLVKNKILNRYPDGGARLSQVGAAKVLPVSSLSYFKC